MIISGCSLKPYVEVTAAGLFQSNFSFLFMRDCGYERVCVCMYVYLFYFVSKQAQWFWSHLKSFSCIFNNISWTTAFFHSFSKSNSFVRCVRFFLFVPFHFCSDVSIVCSPFLSFCYNFLFTSICLSFLHIRAINNIILKASKLTVTALTVTVICDNYDGGNNEPKKIVIS